jgi:hypothetical protein
MCFPLSRSRPTNIISLPSYLPLATNFIRIAYFARTRPSTSFVSRARIGLQNQENLAHPTRFERVTFAFGARYTHHSTHLSAPPPAEGFPGHPRRPDD